MRIDRVLEEPASRVGPDDSASKVVATGTRSDDDCDSFQRFAAVFAGLYGQVLLSAHGPNPGTNQTGAHFLPAVPFGSLRGAFP